LKRKPRKTLNLSTERAAHALHVLIADGKIAARDVTNALKGREQLLHELRQKLAALEGRAISAIAQVRKAVVRNSGRKKPKLSAETLAKYRQQGKYLSAMRPLSKRNRAKVKAIRKKSGVHAAIRAARTIAKPAASGTTAQGRGARSNRPNYQSSQQRKLARYQERERPKPDKHGGSGAGRQQGGSGPGREHG
jgi:hypothetical protein